MKISLGALITSVAMGYFALGLKPMLTESRQSRTIRWIIRISASRLSFKLAGSSKVVKLKKFPYVENSMDTMVERASSFAEMLQRRRTVRDFSSRRPAEKIILDCLRAAASSPSGANQQPWHFVLVKDQAMKHNIRVAAEKEEQEFYSGRAPLDWLKALQAIGTDANKSFLEEAPYLIAVFQERYHFDENNLRIKHYYAPESVGLATGFLITAIHNAGLVCLTHTPSPMKFLNGLLSRPKQEKPFLLLVVGYPADSAMVPELPRKNLEEVVTII